MAKNCKMTVKGTVLTIEVDLSKRFGPSGSGKTMIIASTEGSVKLDAEYEGVSVGLNVYTKDMTEPKESKESKGKGK
jgi:ABC-type molybdate transport system ATPase subunit